MLKVASSSVLKLEWKWTTETFKCNEARVKEMKIEQHKGIWNKENEGLF